MPSRLYRLPSRESSGRDEQKSSATLEAIEHHLATLAEGERPRQLIRTCRIIERREHRERRDRQNLTSCQ